VHAAIRAPPRRRGRDRRLRHTQEGKLAQGQSVQVGDYTLTYLGASSGAPPYFAESRAAWPARGAGGSGNRARRQNRYFAERRPRTRSRFVRTGCGRRLFVIADQFNPDGSVFVKVIVNPLVNLIWLAGLLFVAGALITLWPDAREQRRLARRFAEEGALARA
jgi:cytochrome c-type biogenesis protein CcmF